MLSYCAVSRGLLTSLLMRRAITAYQLGFHLRSLADSGFALVLTNGGRRSAFVHALALITQGACMAAVAVLSSGQPRSVSRAALLPWLCRHRLSAHILATAAQRQEVRVLAAVEALCDAPNTTGPIGRELAYMHGSLRIARLAGKGRGLVATVPIVAGTILLVDPTIFPRAPSATSRSWGSTSRTHRSRTRRRCRTSARSRRRSRLRARG